MLRYFGMGARRYGERPLVPFTRPGWEFEAVLRGRCGPVFRGAAEHPLSASTLWIFPPDLAHGWTGAAGETCQISVMHFRQVPPLLERWVRSQRYLALPLAEHEAQQIRAWTEAISDDYTSPTALSGMRFERLLLDLTLLAMAHAPAEHRQAAGESPAERVGRALAWYRENMASGARVSDVAGAVFLSESQLRRVFARAGRHAPLAEMKQLQLARAQELLAHSGLSVAEVAEACGFSCASDLSRVFRRLAGCSPLAYRLDRGRDDANRQQRRIAAPRGR